MASNGPYEYNDKKSRFCKSGSCHYDNHNFNQYQYFSFDARVGCAVPCHFEYYDNHISYSSLPNGSYLEDLVITSSMNKDSIREDIVSVSIFFEDLQVTTTTTEYSYPFTAFLADLGGALGLFLGASLIAFIEIGLLLLDEFKRICLPRKCKKKMNEIDAGLKLPEITDESEQSDEPNITKESVKETNV